MEAAITYSKYDEHACIIKSLFNRYDRYKACIAIKPFEADIDVICRKMSLDYANLVGRVSLKADSSKPAIDFENALNCEYATMSQDQKISLVIQLINFIDKRKENIIDILNVGDGLTKDLFLSNIEISRNMVQKLINRMEVMIKSSQYINLSYLRATA